MGNVASVPAVPGANGLSPLPKPKAIKYAGRLKINFKSGEVIKAMFLEGEGFVLFIEHYEFALPRNFADTGEGQF